ncbi:KilA-N domain-containing protein, partial [Salmonella enterica]
RKDRVGGTWLHPKLSFAFARWCDTKFSVWCDLIIDSLLSG